MPARVLALITLACALTLQVGLGAQQPIDVPVADAARRGERETVRTLLQGGADVNAAHGDGMTALHWASMSDDLELVEMLLYAGANVTATTRLGAYTPLFLAARHGNPAVVAALLDAGAEVGAAATNGTTPLMVAAAAGSDRALRLLLEHGAAIDAVEHAREQSAVMFAAAFGRTGAVEVLARRGANLELRTTIIDVDALDKARTAAGRLRAARVAAAEKDAEEARKAEEARRAALTSGQAQADGEQAEEVEVESAADATARELRGQEGREERRRAAREGGDDADGKPNPLRRLFGWLIPGGGESEPEPEQPRARRLTFGQLVGHQGGLTALHFAARGGHRETVDALLAAGATIDAVTGDGSTPLLIATINGHFDLAGRLIDMGADPTLASDAGATPLYAALNVQWAPKTLYPQPRAYLQQRTTYLDLMARLLELGVNPNVRLKKKIWYSGYNFDLSGVNEVGATPFWRAAYASDIDAMRLLVAHGADPHIPTTKPAQRPRTGDQTREVVDHSGLPPVPVGGPAVTPLQAAAGVGYGEGFAANSHRNVPGGWLPAVRYLVEELGADVNAADHEGFTALHHAAARGDNEMIEYLVSKGADVMAVTREGQSTADMANGPVQRVEPYPETLALLTSLGAINNNNCVSC